MNTHSIANIKECTHVRVQTLVDGDAAVVIWTWVARRSSQSMGDFLAQPSDVPVPFQLLQSKSITPHPTVDDGSVGPVSLHLR